MSVLKNANGLAAQRAERPPEKRKTKGSWGEE